jgi:hypothetical protein
MSKSIDALFNIELDDDTPLPPLPNCLKKKNKKKKKKETVKIAGDQGDSLHL